MPRRNKKKIELSQGEAFCGKYLSEKGLNPIGQYRISSLPRYRYDYYFEYQGRSYLLEFDGRQHFEYTPWFHRSQKSFYSKRTRDFLKMTVALMNGYYIIRIAYPDLPRLDEIINSALSGKGRLHFSDRQKYSYFLERKIPHTWLLKYGSHLPLGINRS